MTPAMPAGLMPAGPRGPAWGRNWLLKGCPAPIYSTEKGVVRAGPRRQLAPLAVPRLGSYRAVLAQLLALLLLQRRHCRRGRGRGSGGGGSHGGGGSCLGEVSWGPAGVRGEPHATRASGAAGVTAGQRGREGAHDAPAAGRCQDGVRRDTLTWRQSLARRGRRCGRRCLAAHSPCQAPPR